MKRWPHRQISGINRALTDLEAQHDVAEGGEMLTVTEQLCQLHRRREVIIEVRFFFLIFPDRHFEGLWCLRVWQLVRGYAHVSINPVGQLFLRRRAYVVAARRQVRTI